MKIDFTKTYGGVLVPFTDLDSEKMTKFKTGEVYTGDLKLTRNPEFHKKVMTFLSFCFKFWVHDNNYLTEQAQYDWFRKKLTITAGYYNERYDLYGNIELEAKSLSYGNMEQDEFEEFHKAVTQAAMNTIFKGCDEYTTFNYKGRDVLVYETLIGFF